MKIEKKAWSYHSLSWMQFANATDNFLINQHQAWRSWFWTCIRGNLIVFCNTNKLLSLRNTHGILCVCVCVYKRNVSIEILDLLTSKEALKSHVLIM